MLIRLIIALAFYSFVGWRILLERAHAGPASAFLPLWAWIALVVVSLPAALLAVIRQNKALKIPENVHTAVRELERRQQLKGFDALMMLASRAWYGGMAIWCVVFIYQHFTQWKQNAVFPVIVAIALVNMAYNTVVQLVAWSAFHRKAIDIDDLYQQIRE